MEIELPYHAGFDPPAPAVEVDLSPPGSTLTERVLALLDSGAATTAVPHSAIQRLGLRRIGVVEVQDLEAISRVVPVFSALITVDAGRSWAIEAIGWPGPFILLGRDLMNLWRITLDGPAKTVRIDPT